jgi:PAS domain S-box-containing protein
VEDNPGLASAQQPDDSRRIDAQFRSLFEAAPDAILIVDSTGRIILVNEQTEQLFGYHRLELHGQLIEALLPERFVAGHVALRDGYIGAPRTRPMGSGLSLSGRRRDGSEVPVEISLSPVIGAAGQQVIAIVRDVTERREAERMLAEQTAQLKERSELLDLAGDAILVRGASDGDILFWNHGAELLYGWTKDEAIGCVSHELLHTQYPVSFAEIETELVRNQSWRGELVHTCKNGRQVTVDSRWTVEHDLDGQPRAYLELNTDITARKQAELDLQRLAAELSRSNAELEQFTYVASHDLQEPLRMVASYTQLLARRYQGKLDEDADEFIHYAVDGAKRMQELIQDLLSYARVGSAGSAFDRVNCQELVAELTSDMRSTLESASADVRVGSLPQVSGDQVQLRQVFQNLIGNAVKYCGNERPRIDISAERSDGTWTFSVRDNGIGIEPQYTEQVFSMFKRLHGRDRYEGTGIGLAICKKIVERHGGRIWVESQPGDGSTFRFTLPDGETAAL